MSVIPIQWNHIMGKDKANLVNQSKSVILVHSNGCHFCKEYMPTYQKVASKCKTKFYEAETNKQSPTVIEKIIQQAKDRSGGIPITFIYNKAKLVSYKEGQLSEEELVSWLKANGAC